MLLVDDVVTTGATLLAARNALLRAGVGTVVCVAAAATSAAPQPMVATSSRKAVRSASAPNLAKAG